MRVAEVNAYETGQPCWADVTSPDVGGAAAFYSALFGWEAATDQREEAGGYTMLSLRGKPVAAASPPPQENIPPHWTVYLAADDVDAVAARVRDAGGSVLMEPFDVLDAGRMTMAADPGGAVFGVWQAGAHHGSALAGEPGTMNWAEVQTRDPAAVRAFYERVFGFGSETMDMGGAGDYVLLKVGERPVAGVIEIGAEWGDVPSNWSVVFQVEDCDAAVDTVRELGGGVLVEPREIEGVGRFAVVSDRFGAVFQVIK